MDRPLHRHVHVRLLHDGRAVPPRGAGLALVPRLCVLSPLPEAVAAVAALRPAAPPHGSLPRGLDLPLDLRLLPVRRSLRPRQPVQDPLGLRRVHGRADAALLACAAERRGAARRPLEVVHGGPGLGRDPVLRPQVRHVDTTIYVYMCVYIYIYIYVYVYTHIYIYMYTCVYMCMHVYACVCIYVYIYIYIRISISLSLYVCIYIYIYTHVCIYNYIII